MWDKFTMPPRLSFLNCPTCKFVWTRLDICDHLPIHDCSKFQGKNPPRKPPREIILEYIAANPDSTFGEICNGIGKTCPGGIAKTEYHVECSVAVGDILKTGDPPRYFLPDSK